MLCSLRALLGGRNVPKCSLLNSEATSICFVMLLERSVGFPSRPEDEQLYLCFFWYVRNRKKNRTKVMML